MAGKSGCPKLFFIQIARMYQQLVTMKATVALKLVAVTNRRLTVFHLNNAKALHIHSDSSEILEMHLIKSLGHNF